jgi:hypothetical protein
MLSDNLIYIYDQKFEHNGPYKDLKVKKLAFLDKNSVNVSFAKVAAGVYKLNTSLKLKEINIVLDKLKIILKE